MNGVFQADYGYFDINQTYAWQNRFASAYELLQMFCQTFGIIARYSFGDANGLIDNDTPANNKPRLTFNSRGRSFANNITPDGEMLSDPKQISETTLKNTNYRAATYYDFGDGITTALYYNDMSMSSVPANAVFDFDVTIDFEIDGIEDENNLCSGETVPEEFIDKVEYWNYIRNEYTETITIPWIDKNIVTALIEYLFNRFSLNRIQYDREYNSIKANNTISSSQRWMQTLRSTSINDGVSAITLYATKVGKNVITNKSSVIWVQQ
jgi:hypothetical protein